MAHGILYSPTTVANAGAYMHVKPLDSHAWLACTYLWDRLKTLHRLSFDAIRWSPHVNLEEGGGSRRLHARSFNLIENACDTDLDKGIHCNNSFPFLVWHMIELQAGMHLQQVPPAGCRHNCFLTVLSQPGKPEPGYNAAATFRPHTHIFPFLFIINGASEGFFHGRICWCWWTQSDVWGACLVTLPSGFMLI